MSSSYDRMDNIVNKATEHGPYTYNYDSLYRLAGAVSPALPQESYSYDPVGAAKMGTSYSSPVKSKMFAEPA